MNTTDIHYNKLFQDSIASNWDRPALTDYQGATLQYKDVARKIEKIHIVFEQCGVKKGDKVALCGRNSSHWGVTFIATLAYGAVAVPILPDFSSDQVANIVNHSESKVLFVGDYVVKNIVADDMPNLVGIINLPDFSIHTSRSEQLTYAREHLNELFGQKYPRNFRPEHLHYHNDSPDELALINYTSGTTGFSKGAMLPYRALWSNITFCNANVYHTLRPGDNMLAILPMAHMYGLAFDLLSGMAKGCHINFLTRLPSPAIIADALAQVKPAILIAVPLVVEKIIRKRVFPIVQTHRMRLLLSTPVVARKVKQRICEQVMQAFGGNIYQVVVGGASLSHEVERFLMDIGFPVTVGYGTTECAPLISVSDWKQAQCGSCGQPVDNIEVRIAGSDNPATQPGEIVVRGMNVMLGYYKNPEATAQVIDSEGWYHTGDLATMSADGHIFIRGRIKSMLLGANGQNIYPEEIEDKLNSMPMVAESVVVQAADNRLVGLVFPDQDETKALGLDSSELAEAMEQNRKQLNEMLPAYCRLSAIELRDEEFAKTPKNSIKRYLYSASK